MAKFPICKPLLGAFGMLSATLGSQRHVMKKIQEFAPQFAAYENVFKPVYDAYRQGSLWRQGVSKELEKITKTMDPGTMENVLAAIIDPAAGSWHTKLSAAERTQGKALEKLWSKMLQKTAGLSEADAHRFITKDFGALRAAGGDLNRFGGLRNSYPKSFHPLMQEILDGGLNVNNSNAYGVTWDLIHMGERLRWLTPATKTAFKEVARWKGLKGVNEDDFIFASNQARGFLKHVVQQRDSQQTYFTKTIESTINKLNSVLGKDKIELDSNTINRWSTNMAGWYSGAAMAYRPALAIRNMTQVLLPMSIVGYGRGGRALKMVYGKDRDKHIKRALDDQGLDVKGENAVYVGEGSEGGLGNKLFRTIRRFQNEGMRGFRWADRVNNRATTWLMGEMAILEEYPALAKAVKAGDSKAWVMFMWKTGLKGRSKVDQKRMHSLLMGREHPDVPSAAREFGRELVADTQFLYESINAPAAFRGTGGRLFGQFGTWPMGFAELIHQNTIGAGDALWSLKFAANYGKQKLAISALGLATGVDTSTWNFSNPLTFQGGPWYQALRDITVLGTSQNEFERRQARGLVNRMFGVTGTPWTTVLNPIGSVTADAIQGLAAMGPGSGGGPAEAALLALGFNTRSSAVATRR